MSTGFNRSELMVFFLAEVDEQLLLLEQEILKLEQQRENTETIQSIFRAAHTLKGSSAAMGFDEMKQLTHEMENILDKIRRGHMTVSAQVVNVLFRCLDQLGVFKKEIETEGHCKTNIDSIVNLIKSLEANKPEPLPKKDSTSYTIKLTIGQKDLLTQAEKKGYNLWICEVKFSERCEMKSARAFIIQNHLHDLGTIVTSKPSLEEVPDEADFHSGFIRFLITTSHEAKTIEESINGLLDVEHVSVFAFTNDSMEVEITNIVDRASQPGQRIQEHPKAEEEVRKIGHTIRVDVERLENLMNLVGELVIDQTRIAQVGTVLRDHSSSDETLDELEQISNHISRVVGELQESVMKTRMLPIEQLFNRFPRMVRDLSQHLNKDISLIIEGKETELDRTVIEEIGDPLIHLIRNAIDHGIEDAKIRQHAGKPAEGSIRIKANHQENQVVLTVEDDGAGIDAENIKESAIRKELITPQQADAMTPQELIQLIFLPGFSTAKVVSDISGRGVGMDIVRDHIEKLNGLIDVETVLGQGTRFTIKLPLTLAILRGLLIKLKDTTYALPMSSVIEIVRISKKEINSIKGQTVVKIREKVLPLIWLHDYFKMNRVKKKNNVFIIVIGIAERRLGLVVDELIGNQEIVVKSMGSYIGKIEGVSGATILGDGSVALILDVTGIFKIVGKERPAYMEEIEGVI